MSTCNARHVEMTAEQYHAHPAVGSSMLETFREARRTYRARYVDGGDPKPAATEAQALGTLVHVGLLEPERWDSLVAPPTPEVAPDGKKWLRRKGSDHERWWQDEVDARAGRIIVDTATLAVVDRVCEAASANPAVVKALGQPGAAEHSIVWTHPGTAIECKARIDWMGAVAVDIKTAACIEPSTYANSLIRYGYHRKRAHYMEGLAALTGDPKPKFVHVALETSPPFRTAVYELDDCDAAGLSLGEGQRRAALYDLARCIETGDWREAWERQPVTLTVPKWAWSENDYHMGSD